MKRDRIKHPFSIHVRTELDGCLWDSFGVLATFISKGVQQ